MNSLDTALFFSKDTAKMQPPYNEHVPQQQTSWSGGTTPVSSADDENMHAQEYWPVNRLKDQSLQTPARFSMPWSAHDNVRQEQITGHELDFGQTHRNSQMVNLQNNVPPPKIDGKKSWTIQQ